jgi:hypothetical protein
MTEEALQEVEWSHAVRLPVLGVMITFVTNSAAVIEVIHDLYGSWARLDSAMVSASNALVKIVVRDDIAIQSPQSSALRYHVPDPARMRVESFGARGSADTTRLESTAVVSTSMVARTDFGEGVLEPLTLFLLGALDREPLHAAGIVQDGAALLLAGPSGAGKSTLAYAACRGNRYSLLADEPVYVQMHPVLRVWGRRPRVHLQADSCTHFPELCDIPARQLATGKTKIVLDLQESPRLADRAGICLVSRAPGQQTVLEPLTPEQVTAELGRSLEPGYDLFAHTMRDRIIRIAEGGAWRLQVGGAPGDAVPLLDRIAAKLARS